MTARVALYGPRQLCPPRVDVESCVAGSREAGRDQGIRGRQHRGYHMYARHRCHLSYRLSHSCRRAKTCFLKLISNPGG